MVQVDAQIIDLASSGPFKRVALAAPAIAPGLAAGRFVLADLGGYLRTPLFPARLPAEPEDDSFEMLVPLDHPVAALQPGPTVNLIGPLGCGFEVDAAARHLLLVAATAHLPPLLPLTQRGLEQERSVTLLLSTPTAAALYPIQLLPPALEVHIVTTDGSAGHGGSVLDLLPDLACWADCVCIADDPATYPALAEIVRQVRVAPGRRFAQALVTPPMVCGVGACQGCAVEMRRGIRLACTDGPVFDLLELS
jgi:dihydroorotate dehydrogenase electron transfer subunit